MGTELKFCGLTRPEDASEAVAAGASYLGVIFAGGPRQLTPEAARHVLAAAPGHVRRVGVFGDQTTEEIAHVARIARLDIVQLHSDPTVAAVERVRAAVRLPVWAAVRLAGCTIPEELPELFGVADAVVLDARVEGRLGGTGTSLPWGDLAPALQSARESGGCLVLAGGLSPENVSTAISLLAPDVVDVSSGVELLPGIKDAARMRAFAASVSTVSPNGS